MDDSVRENVVYRGDDGMTYDENGLPVKVENEDNVTIKEAEDQFSVSEEIEDSSVDPLIMKGWREEDGTD